MTTRTILTTTLLMTSLFAPGCSRSVATDTAPPQETPMAAASPTPEKVPDNPLLRKSTLQYEAPDYASIRVEHFIPAFEEGMKAHKEEIRAIAENKESPTFENTIVALEKSGDILSRSQDVFYSLSGTVSTPEIRAIEATLAPREAAHYDAMYLNPQLYARIKQIYDSRSQLEPEAKRLTEKYYEGFVRAGAKLDEDAKSSIRSINAELSELSTQFSQNLLKFTQERAVVVDDRASLEGLSETEISSLAAAAKASGQDGKYVINLLNTTRHPLLSKLANRDLREKLWRASAERGIRENGPVLQRMVELRAHKAQLLGYASWADYVLEAQMAKTPQAVFSMLDDMAPQVMAKTKSEAAEIQKVMKAEKVKHELEPWDWFYYGEKVRAKKYSFDDQEARAYFELDRVMKDGVFFAMQKLFGITFKERNDLPTYHPDVRTFEVFDEAGQSVGLFYADYFAREGKRGGAWMNAIVGQSKLLGRKPVIVNCLNIAKPAEGQPALLEFSEVTTMFHEMGHAVHGLFSNATYPTLAGTSVPRDFVEFPSQFEEDWAVDPAVLANYAKHYQTGAAIPADMMKKMLAAAEFNKGFDSLEYIKAALLDLEWHATTTKTTLGDVEGFERAVFREHGVDYPVAPPRYKSAYFSHVFSGGYSAGYYAYIWTEVLAADAFAFMKTQGGLNRANGDRFRDAILSRGNTIDPMQQYINYRGQAPTVDALLSRRGLVK